MTREDIKALVVCRLENSHGECNGYYFNHVSGQLRALEYVLTGEVPDGDPLRDVPSFLERVGIPHRVSESGGEFEWDVPWLKDHGFEVEGVGDDASIHHPKYSTGW